MESRAEKIDYINQIQNGFEELKKEKESLLNRKRQIHDEIGQLSALGVSKKDAIANLENDYKEKFQKCREFFKAKLTKQSADTSVFTYTPIWRKRKGLNDLFHRDNVPEALAPDIQLCVAWKLFKDTVIGEINLLDDNLFEKQQQNQIRYALRKCEKELETIKSRLATIDTVLQGG